MFNQSDSLGVGVGVGVGVLWLLQPLIDLTIFKQSSIWREMKKEQRNHASHLIDIRKQRRRVESQQIKNSIRFKCEVEGFIDEDVGEEDIEVITQERLESYFQNQDYDALFDCLIKGEDEAVHLLESNIIPIIDCLFQRLSNPKCALALYNICKKSIFFIGYIFQASLFNDITHHLQKMAKGSKQQRIYLSCISEILQAKQFVKIEQLGPLYSQVSEIFMRNLAEQREDNLTIRVIASLVDLSTPQICFAEEFVIQFLEFFWKAQNAVNFTNIYCSTASLVERRIYKRSVTILLNVVRIIIHGRKKLQIHQEEDLPSKLKVLHHLFKFYNDNREYLQGLGVIRGQDFRIETTLHCFLLQYERDIFQNFERSGTFFQFLEEFCKNGPSDAIAQVWSELGLLEQLIDELTEAPNHCYYSLKICLVLLARNSAISSNIAGNLMKNCSIQEKIEQVLQFIHDSKVVSTSLAILEYLKGE